MKKSIIVENVNLAYKVPINFFRAKTIHAVRDLSFNVIKGEMLSLIGFNGSGKTSTLSMIAGIIHPDTGNIIVEGKIVPFLGLGIGFNPELTCKENVYLYGAIMGLSKKDIKKNYERIVEFAELQDFMNLKIKELSSGMYVRLGFSVAIHTSPDILIIDEVLAVGDISFQRKCFEEINKLKRKGITILFVSHDMGLVARFSDRVLLLDKGKKIDEGKPENVIDTYMHLKKNIISIESKRRGSREIEIKNIKLNHDNKLYKKNENIIIEIEYNNNANIKTGICGFALYSENGILIAGPNIFDATGNYFNFEKSGKYTIEFNTNKLLSGKYYLTLAIYDKTNRFAYDHIEYAEYFTIEGDKKEYSGLIEINTKWKK